MSEPATEFLRRSQVDAWLEGLGISRMQTRTLIEEKVIKGAPLRNGSAPARKKKRKKYQGRAKGCMANYYRKSQIKEALGLK